MTWMDEAAKHLLADEVILCPTDTIWGISASALAPHAIQRIQKIKQRPENKSFILLMRNMEQLSHYLPYDLSYAQEFLQEQTRPTTVIYPRAQNLPQDVIAHDGSIAVRIPTTEWLQQLLQIVDRPVVSTSANISGQESPLSRNQIDTHIVNGVDYVANPPFDLSENKGSQIVRLLDDGRVEWLRR